MQLIDQCFPFPHYQGRKYLFAGVLSLPIFHLINSFFPQPFNMYYDNVASITLAFFLIAEYKLVNEKYRLQMYSFGRMSENIIQEVIDLAEKNTQDERNKMAQELREKLQYEVETANKIHLTNLIKLQEKRFECTDKVIIFGIFISTVVWGFGGLFKSL